MGVGNLTITHLETRERYRLDVEDEDGVPVEAGYLDYTVDGDNIALTHTVIFDQFGGRGLAAKLVEHVLSELRDSGRQVVPVCTYVERYVAKHPEYADLVAS